MKAWYLGDREAISQAFPNHDLSAFADYRQDAQCSTWETLLKAFGSENLRELLTSRKRSVRVLEEKHKWAAAIAPKMNVEKNTSPSFCCFRDGLRRLTGEEKG